MKLSTLLKSPLHHDCEITGLSLDSREIKPGYLFIAYHGSHFDGREYIKDAIAKGASAVVTEAAVQETYKVPVILVPEIRKRLAEMAADFYRYPAHSLRMIGVTGTNGKTSCSHFIASLLEELNIRCGIIGTLGSGLCHQLTPHSLTTPDVITLQRTFADLLALGAKAISMEVSSHSLDQGRVNGIEFEVGVFTNLTRDHLDYHGSMEAYGAAKKKLFDQSQYAVINSDDEYGRMLSETEACKNIVTYSTQQKHATVFADNIFMDLSGISAKLYSPWGAGMIKVPLIGQFNLSNVLAVFTTLCLMKVPFDQVLLVLSTLKPVPGRMEALGGGKKPLVVVDYSHTPDALEKVLLALRHHCQGQLYCLFGCGGDRDRGKRPMMAKIAEKYANSVLVTDDNPRTEKPEQIVADIMQGFSDVSKVKVEHNRSKAIKEIIQYAKAGDCVLIAGKGAETYQLIGNEKIPFSDVEKAMTALQCHN